MKNVIQLQILHNNYQGIVFVCPCQRICVSNKVAIGDGKTGTVISWGPFVSRIVAQKQAQAGDLRKCVGTTVVSLRVRDP